VAAEAGVAEPAGETLRFVTFVVEGRAYAVPIAAVREIIRWAPVTPLPNQPAHARGVLNLRGAIVPVHDLRARLSGTPTEAGASHVIVITRLGAQTPGILVDSVSDILSVPAEALQPPPAAVESATSLALVSVGQDRLVTVLNLSALYGPGAGEPA
jgi:purine-binding chemotaxis protein CheW